MNSFSIPMDLPRFDVALVDCKSKSVNIRYAACQALALASAKQADVAVKTLVSMFQDQIEDVRAQAVEGLCQLALSGASVPKEPVLAALSDSSDFVRSAALENLDLFVDTAGAYARECLRDPSPGVRVSAVRLLGDLDEAGELTVLHALLKDEDRFVLEQTALVLCKHGDTAGVDILCEMIANRGPDSVNAAYALGFVQTPKAEKVLAQTVEGRFVSRELKAAAAVAYARYDDSSMEKLRSLLGSSRTSMRVAALRALSILPFSPLAGDLAQIVLRGKSSEERSMAIVALGAMKTVDKSLAQKEISQLQKNIGDGFPAELREELEEVWKEVANTNE